MGGAEARVIDVDARALRDPPFYVRTEVDDDVVRRYSEALEAGATFPPVVGAYFGDGIVLLDGAHRRAAHIRRGLWAMRAELVDIEPAEFVLEALRRNASHGRPLTADDQQRTVIRLRTEGVPFARIVEATRIPLHRLERFLVQGVRRPTPATSARPALAPRPVIAHPAPPAERATRGPADGAGCDPIERALVELTDALVKRDLQAVPADILLAWRRRAAMAVEVLERAMLAQARHRPRAATRR